MTTRNSTTNGGANNRISNGNTGGGGRGGRRDRGKSRKKDGDKTPWKQKGGKSGFQGNLQDGALKGMVITDGNARSTQFEKLLLCIPTYCAEKGYTGLNEIVKNENDWDEDNFFTPEPDLSQWSKTLNIEVGKDATGAPVMCDKVIITDQPLCDSKMKEYDRKNKYEHTRWNKCQEDKSALITIIHGQLDDGTKNNLELSPEYEKAVVNADLVTVIKILRKICYGTDDGGMSFKPYKATVAVKSLNNFTNPKTSNPHKFKDELKTKYKGTLAIANRFPNGTVYMEEMLSRHDPPKTIEDYFKMTADQQTHWEKEGDKLNIAMLFLLNSKNETMKKELRLAYSQGSTDCYPLEPDAMARLYATQYRVKNGKDPKGNGTKHTKPSNDKDEENPEDDEQQETLGAHVGPGEGPDDAPNNNNDNSDTADGTAGVHHVNNAVEQVDINELLGSHPVDDPLWDTNDDIADDGSLDSNLSAEEIIGMHASVWDGYDTSEESVGDEESTPTHHSQKNTKFSDDTESLVHVDAESEAWLALSEQLEMVHLLKDDGDLNTEQEDSHDQKPKSREDNVKRSLSGTELYATIEVPGAVSVNKTDRSEIEQSEEMAGLHTSYKLKPKKQPYIKGRLGASDDGAMQSGKPIPTNMSAAKPTPKQRVTKYYAVANGREPGIYTSWATCAPQVHKYSEVTYNSFPTKEEAEHFIQAYNSIHHKQRGATSLKDAPRAHQSNKAYARSIKGSPKTMPSRKSHSHRATMTSCNTKTAHVKSDPASTQPQSNPDFGYVGAMDRRHKVLHLKDSVTILTPGKWDNVVGRSGSIVGFGDGSGQEQYVTIRLPNTPLQYRKAKNVEFLYRRCDDTQSKGDFHLGKH